jgi:hypothetical protein
MSNCAICEGKIEINNIMHEACFISMYGHINSKIELHKKQPPKCVICNRTLPPKTTKNYHKKCVLERQTQDEKRCIIKVSRDIETCTVQY